jgi:hypothetical protein
LDTSEDGLNGAYTLTSATAITEGGRDPLTSASGGNGLDLARSGTTTHDKRKGESVVSLCARRTARSDPIGRTAGQDTIRSECNPRQRDDGEGG